MWFEPDVVAPAWHGVPVMTVATTVAMARMIRMASSSIRSGFKHRP
jgi:hypothetical protein